MLRRSATRLVALTFALCAVVMASGPVFEAVQAAQGSLPAAREVIDKYVNATGGSAAFKAIKSMRARGTFTVTGQAMSGSLEMMAARPNKLLTKISVAGMGPFEEGYDGKIGWSIDPLNGPALTTGKALSERADEAWFDGPLHAADFIKDMTVVGREEFDKRQVYRVKVTTARGTEQIEFFEVDSGLQAGVEATRDTQMGSMPVTTIFRDHQRFGQLTFPAKVVQRLLGQEQIVVFSAYEFDSVPATTFELPAVIKALIK